MVTRESGSSVSGRRSGSSGAEATDAGPTMVAKALVLLDCFRGSDAPKGLTELARRTGLPKSTAFRLLAHLEESGYVERHGKQYGPGRLLFELGAAADNTQPLGLRVAALPYMADLYAQWRQTIVLGVLNGRDVLHVGRIRGARSTPVPVRFGSSTPATCSALGKIILANRPEPVLQKLLEEPLPLLTRFSLGTPGVLLQQLREAQARGYAVEREETALGVVSVAVPIRVSRTTVAALGVLGKPQGFTERTYVPSLHEAAANIAVAMLRPPVE